MALVATAIVAAQLKRKPVRRTFHIAEGAMCTLSQNRARPPRSAHVAVFLAWCIVPTAVAQTPAVESLTAGSAVVWSERVPAGELHGAVVDAATGLPLDSIWVAIDGTNTLALTNPAGQFVLRGIGKGGERYLVRAYAPGFRIEELVVTTRGDLDGWAARFSMRRPPEQCESTTFVVRAIVRDALTGSAPTSRIALRVRHDSIRAWGFNQARSGDTAISVSAYIAHRQLAPVVRPKAPLEVEVAAPGYALWTLPGLPVEFDDCGNPLLDSLKVWLLPRDAVGDESPWTGGAF